MAGLNYTSKRQYLNQTELAEFADITISDTTEADDQISQAEEIIDAYVGFQEKFTALQFRGQFTAVSGTTFTDTSGDTMLTLQDNFFTFCELEIVAGTGAGQKEIISSSSLANKSVTIRTAFSTTPDTTSIYKIHQLGKFPRCTDYYYEPDSETYYKYIPGEVRRAVAAQVEYMINQGSAYFATDQTDKDSERIGNYSYSKSNGSAQGTSLSKLIAPKARAILKGFRNAGGEVVAENPTNVNY